MALLVMSIVLNAHIEDEHKPHLPKAYMAEIFFELILIFRIVNLNLQFWILKMCLPKNAVQRLLFPLKKCARDWEQVRDQKQADDRFPILKLDF